MVTWWRQPGDKTMKRQTKNTMKHISIEMARFEIGLFNKCGWDVVDHGHKITAVKKK